MPCDGRGRPSPGPGPGPGPGSALPTRGAVHVVPPASLAAGKMRGFMDEAPRGLEGVGEDDGVDR